MIIGIIHKGSGLGDQLFSYLATRVRATDLGVDYGFVGKEFFKGKDIFHLNWGLETDDKYHIEQPAGKLIVEELPSRVYEINKRCFDPEFDFLKDGTIIDGYGAQDLRYFERYLPEIRKWLKTEWLEVGEKTILNIRGGEYRAVPELFLPQTYWQKAITLAPNADFEIHTDDLQLAHEWFPTVPAIQNIKENWLALRYAKYAIISNSAFAIIPRLLKHSEDSDAVTIAPKYWNRYNILKRWDWPMNYYPQFFTYIE